MKNRLNKLNIYYDRVVLNVCIHFKSMIYVYIFVCLYKILFDLIYCSYIAEKHALFFLNISLINIINGWFATILMAFFIKLYYEQNSCSAIMMIALNMIYFIPITTYCGYGGGSSSFLLFSIIYWAILSVLQIKLPILCNKNKYGFDTKKIIYVIVICVSVFSLYIWYKYSGFRIELNLLNVYEIRRIAAENNLPLFLSYFWHMTNIVVPILIVLMLNMKKYFFVLWLLFITLINFSYAGNKSIILFPLILIGGYVFYRRDMITLIFPIGILLEILAIIEQKLGTIFITSYLFRRQGVVLAQLSDNYYRFFLENPTDIFRNGILGKLGFENIYNNNIVNVIGNNFDSQTINCNNGLLADVWSGLGVIGIVVMPIIIIVCFRILDYAAYMIDMRLMIGLVLYYAIMFANTTWSTVLLTHGFLILCIILVIFPRKKEFDRKGVGI